jgi:hypothetical protein
MSQMKKPMKEDQRTSSDVDAKRVNKGNVKSKKKDKPALKRKGTFTAKAAKKGITTSQLQTNVEKDPDKYDDKTKKQAELRKKLANIKARKKLGKFEE